MRDKQIFEAAKEAKRFLKAADAYYERRKRGDLTLIDNGCKESGALRRASLDLTRALAAMRKP